MPSTPPQKPGDAAAPTADARLAQLEAQAAEHLAGWRRARADYENLQKRLAVELAEATESGKETLLTTLLPAIDHLDAALETLPQELASHPWAQGLRHAHKAFHDFLASVGLAPVDAAHVPFNPLEHEAVAETPHEAPAGTVVTVVTRGYRRNGRVLRPAKVAVSSGREKKPRVPGAVDADR